MTLVSWKRKRKRKVATAGLQSFSIRVLHSLSSAGVCVWRLLSVPLLCVCVLRTPRVYQWTSHPPPPPPPPPPPSSLPFRAFLCLLFFSGLAFLEIIQQVRPLKWIVTRRLPQKGVEAASRTDTSKSYLQKVHAVQSQWLRLTSFNPQIIAPLPLAQGASQVTDQKLKLKLTHSDFILIAN